jgi:hypothetical protein
MGQQIIETKDPEAIRMTLEREIEKSPKYWKLVHNSSKVSDGDTRKCFTRVYELYIMGEPTGVGIKFFYDYRQGGRTTATFDSVVLKVLSHQIKGDFNEDIIDKYLNEHLKSVPWWRL